MQWTTTGEHSSRQYDQELEAIRSQVLLMGGMVERQLEQALSAFRSGDVALAERVVLDDDAVNRLEVSLDEACSQLIVRRQPAANDLRTVMATTKVITDLERIGDEAAKVARMAKLLHQRGAQGLAHDALAGPIARQASSQLHDALDAFARLDRDQALRLIAADEVVDEALRAILRATITYMMEDPRLISPALDTLWAAKAIERIGDHAKNIAEYVVYIVDGRDIRHSKPQAPADSVGD